MPHGPAIGGKMSSDEWVESGRDISGVGRLGYDDNQPSESIKVAIHKFCVIPRRNYVIRTLVDAFINDIQV